MSSSHFPAFFDEVAKVTLHDPLAQFLGAADKGLIEYRYSDAVRLAGHSCPTVAGAYLMTLKALKYLYGNAIPERGGIKVSLREDATAGVAGVIASVAGLLTGAAGEGGFKGLGGKFSRRNLLEFKMSIKGDIRFTRLDNQQHVDVEYRSQHVPPAPEMATYLSRIQSGDATMDDHRAFGQLWQDRVRRILIHHFDDPELVVLHP